MARFYKTSQPNFVDYSETSTKGGAGQPTAFSLLGDLDIHESDIPRYSEILAGYDAQINELARRAQADPRRANTLMPDVMKLQQTMRNDVEAGELAAFVNRKKDVDANEKLYDKLFEKDPSVSVLAKERFRKTITPANYDPNTRTYEKIQPYDVQVWTPAETEKWRANYSATLKETELGKVKEDEKIGQYQKLITRGSEVGVDRNRALQVAAGKVPQQALQAAQQRRELLNLGNDVDETQFYTTDKEGNIIPNLNTVWGREIEAAAQAATRKEFKGYRGQSTDQAGMAYLKNSLAKSRMSFARDLQAEEDYYPKLKTLYEGTGFNAGETEEGEKIDNSLTGRKFNGGLVSRVVKIPGQIPEIVYDVVVTDPRDKTKKVEQRRQPLDYDVLREVLPKATFQKLQDDAKGDNAWSNERVVKLPFTTDVPGVSEDWTPEKGGQKVTPRNEPSKKSEKLEAIRKPKGTPTYDVQTIEEAQKVSNEDYEYMLRSIDANKQVEQDELIDIEEIIQENE